MDVVVARLKFSAYASPGRIGERYIFSSLMRRISHTVKHVIPQAQMPCDVPSSFHFGIKLRWVNQELGLWCFPAAAVDHLCLATWEFQSC
jgi:hypothetical protein